MSKRTIAAQGTWWGERQGDPAVRPHQDVEVEIGYEDETLYIEGLKDGHGLALELADIARAIAECPE